MAAEKEAEKASLLWREGKKKERGNVRLKRYQGHLESLR